MPETPRPHQLWGAQYQAQVTRYMEGNPNLSAKGAHLMEITLIFQTAMALKCKGLMDRGLFGEIQQQTGTAMRVMETFSPTPIGLAQLDGPLGRLRKIVGNYNYPRRGDTNA